MSPLDASRIDWMRVSENPSRVVNVRHCTPSYLATGKLPPATPGFDAHHMASDRSRMMSQTGWDAIVSLPGTGCHESLT